MEISVWKLEMEMLNGQCFLKLKFEMLNTYMNGSHIYGVGSHRINQGKWKCDRCEDGDKQGASEKHNKAKYT